MKLLALRFLLAPDVLILFGAISVLSFLETMGFFDDELLEYPVNYALAHEQMGLWTHEQAVAVIVEQTVKPAAIMAAGVLGIFAAVVRILSWQQQARQRLGFPVGDPRD